MNLPIESLTRSLVVSRYCRSVILGCRELRRILFLESSPVTEFHDWDYTFTRAQVAIRLSRVSTPSQRSSIIVKAHPVLIPLVEDGFGLRAQIRDSCPSNSTHAILDGTVHKMPPSTLLFQPLPLSVWIFYRGYSFMLESQGGLTFGAMAEGLRHLRSRCQNQIDKLVKLPCTPLNRRRYAQAMVVLDGPTWGYDSVPRAESCIFLAPQGAVCDDSEHLWMTRKGMKLTGW